MLLQLVFVFSRLAEIAEFQRIKKEGPKLHMACPQRISHPICYPPKLEDPSIAQRCSPTQYRSRIHRSQSSLAALSKPQDIVLYLTHSSPLTAKLLNPKLLNPKLLNPRLLKPKLLNPKLLNPRLLKPKLLNPEALNPEISSQVSLIFAKTRSQPLV